MSVTLDINVGASAVPPSRAQSSLWDDFVNSTFVLQANECLEGLGTFTVTGLALSILESSLFWGSVGWGVGCFFSQITMIVCEEDPDQSYKDFTQQLRDINQNYPYVFIISFIFSTVIGMLSTKLATALGSVSGYLWRFPFMESRVGRTLDYHQRKSEEAAQQTAEPAASKPLQKSVSFSDTIKVAGI
jgi:hypothetical protein